MRANSDTDVIEQLQARDKWSLRALRKGVPGAVVSHFMVRTALVRRTTRGGYALTHRGMRIAEVLEGRARVGLD